MPTGYSESPQIAAAGGPASHEPPFFPLFMEGWMGLGGGMEMEERPLLEGARLEGLCAAIGRTPLLRLGALGARCGCEILAKAEFMNPGGSVKDRAALGMILDAERRGWLRPGGVIVEGTAGNTGIGFALVGAARGYRSIAVLPEGIAAEKVALLRAAGAELRVAPDVGPEDPRHYVAQARRIAAETPGGWWANQFDNRANRRIHFETTGPELWAQAGGRLDGFAAAVGSGGTLAGVALYLKSCDARLVTACADPEGAAMYAWVRQGRAECSAGDSVAEGIGQNRVTRNIQDAPLDAAFRIDDRSAVAMQRHLLHAEGLCVGLSAALNVCGAYLLARHLGPGRRVATVLCDGGGRYLSTLFNQDWLAARGLVPVGEGLDFLDALEARGGGEAAADPGSMI